MSNHVREEADFLAAEIEEAVKLHMNLESIIKSYSPSNDGEKRLLDRLKEILSQSESDISKAEDIIVNLREEV